MRVYTVHAPKAAGFAARHATDRHVFVRDGFSPAAFVLGPLWMIWHRLWLALLGYVVVASGLLAVLSLLRAPGLAGNAALLVLALLVGLEATSLRRWTLSRGKWRLLDVVVADDRVAAERRFFDRWSPAQADHRDGATDRGAPPPPRDPRAFPGLTAPRRDIIGLFPQPGAPR